MDNKKENYYVTSDELSDEIELSLQRGEPTVRVCEIFREMAERILHLPRYVGYSTHVKEDLCSCALIKCLKSLKNYKPQFREKTFGYFTMAIESAIWDSLEKDVYRPRNLKSKLILKYAGECINPQQREVLEGMVLPDNTTHTLDKRNYSRKKRRAKSVSQCVTV